MILSLSRTGVIISSCKTLWAIICMLLRACQIHVKHWKQIAFVLKIRNLMQYTMLVLMIQSRHINNKHALFLHVSEFFHAITPEVILILFKQGH